VTERLRRHAVQVSNGYKKKKKENKKKKKKRKKEKKSRVCKLFKE
jgi:hypothetical protein